MSSSRFRTSRDSTVDHALIGVFEDEDDDEEVNLIFNHEDRLTCTNYTLVDSRSSSPGHCGGRHLGLFMAVLSSLFFSLCSLIVRKVESVGSLEHSMMRFVGVLLPSVCLLLSPGSGSHSTASLHEIVIVGTRGSRFTMLLRAVLGSAGLMFQFYAFQTMPLADASVLIFSAPVFVTIFARLFLAEPCGITQVISVAVTLAGVVLISRPPFLFGSYVDFKGYGTDPPSSNLLGALSAISGTVCSANVYILLRKLKSIHYAVIMSSFAVVGVLLSYTGSVVAVGWSSESTSFCLPCTFAERGALVLLGAFSFCGQLLLTKALQLEQAGPVSVCRTADIVFAFIWQVAFLHEVPHVLSVAGALLVTTSVVVVGLRKWALELDRNSTLRRKLWFLVT